MPKYVIELELVDETIMNLEADGYRVTPEVLLVIWDKVNGKDINHQWFNIREIFRISVKEANNT